MRKRMRKTFAGLLAALVFVLAAGTGTVPVQAASGNVYTCTITPCYAHPVTGVIEDSGGEASYATGQGMVEGAIYTTGILELTDSGEYYLTIRMSLMDYTYNHSFQVQNVGDSGWSSTSAGISGTGTDSNGTTNDIVMQVTSENCVVRGTMYVEPMGRDVVFYLYPSNYSSGNSTDMNATIVTEASGSSSSGSGSSSAGTSSGSSSSAGTSSGSSSSGSSLESSSLSTAEEDADSSTDSSTDSDTDSGEESTAPELSSSIEEAADPATDTELGDAQGLSLSTAEDTDSGDSDSSGSPVAARAFAYGLAATISGMILMGFAALLVYFFRKNWRKWGGYEDAFYDVDGQADRELPDRRRGREALADADGQTGRPDSRYDEED